MGKSETKKFDFYHTGDPAKGELPITTSTIDFSKIRRVSATISWEKPALYPGFGTVCFEWSSEWEPERKLMAALNLLEMAKALLGEFS
jgi:hypothetical protein